MVACIFEHIQRRWALNGFTTHGYTCTPARSVTSAEKLESQQPPL
jgi:hypothetical protein